MPTRWKRLSPSYEHGIEKFISRSGKMRGDSVSVKLDIPKERDAESTTLTVQVAPSMATTMLDALPYLIDYPYGCTEQTMSRFLPAAITAKTLRDLGLKPETAMHKIFGGIEAVDCRGNPSERPARSERARAASRSRVWNVFTTFNTPMAVGVGGKKARAITS